MGRLVSGLLASLVALAAGGAAHAQMAKFMPPGADRLPEDLRQYAHTPMVLTPGHSKDHCLDRSRDDTTGAVIRVWACSPDWNQVIWVEPVSGAGQAGEQLIRIRSGEQACLVAGRSQGMRASMGICGDAAGQETWIVRSASLVDAGGNCLDVEAGQAANGARIISAACNAGSPSQQWKLEPMREALDGASHSPPRILGAADNPAIADLPEQVEQLRPRFSPRELTSAERRELATLTKAFGGVDPIKALISSYDHVGKTKKPKPVTIPWSTMKRLKELGETGDKDAMYAALSAYSLIRDTQPLKYSGWTGAEFDHAADAEFVHKLASRLANLWSAHYWQRHGANRLAASAFMSCDTKMFADDCLGYSGTVVSSQHGSFGDWMLKGDKKAAGEVRDIRFHSAVKSYPVRQTEFYEAMRPKSGIDFGGRFMYEQQRAQNHAFAIETGQLQLWDNVMLNQVFAHDMWTSQQEGHMRKTLQARADANTWRAKFEAFMAKPSPELYEQWSIERGLLTQGDADLLRFAARHVVMDEDLSSRLCANGRESTGACTASRQAIMARRDEFDRHVELARQKREAEEAAAYAAQQAQAALDEQERRRLAAMYPPRAPDFWDQLAGLAEGFAAAAEAGNQMVTVRNYDAAGNYVGSETMTRSRAMGLGAQTVD